MEIKPEEYKEYLKEQYLNVHEASEFLDISEEELWKLVHEHQVPTHNIAGAFLRFRKEDIEQLKNKWRIQRELFPHEEKYFAHNKTFKKPGFLDNIRDFWYFNDFYIICSALVMILLYFIISAQ